MHNNAKVRSPWRKSRNEMDKFGLWVKPLQYAALTRYEDFSKAMPAAKAEGSKKPLLKGLWASACALRAGLQ